MSKIVVNALEAVDVEKQKSKRVPAAAGMGQSLGEVIKEELSVREPREGIACSEIMFTFVGAFQLHEHPVPIDSMAKRARQIVRLDLALHEVVLSAGLNCFESQCLVVKAGHHDDRYARGRRLHLLKRTEPLFVGQRKVK